MRDRSGESFVVVLTTLESDHQARSLVRRLVADRVVACGTVIPSATSIYRWKGEVTEATEAVVILKTRRDMWDRLAAAVRAIHPYEVPELLALPVEAGLAEYLQWVASETSPAQEQSA